MTDTHALDVAIDAARAGGRVAMARLGRPGYLSWKGQREVVAEASLQVQDAIVAALTAGAPAAGILAEEGPEDAPVPIDAAHLWIVDPICGSLNFVQGVPFFGVSIALRSAGSIRVGVVYDPCRDELFTATKGTPARLNGETINVQQISDGAEAWAGACVGTDWPRSGQRRQMTAAILGVMADQVMDCSVMGSPALGLCAMAAGRLHGYWHLDLRIWDIAAASLILDRAGGILTDVAGMSWLHSDGGYIASNNVIHNAMQNCLQPMLRG